jgi:phage terminase large subunit
VLGEWPRVGSTAFISPEAVDEAMRRELDPSHGDPLVIGVDVDRYGDDCSVIFPRKGRDCRSIAPQVFRNLPLDQLEDRVVAFCNAHPVQQIFVDGTGLGGGLVDHLIRRGYNVTDVQFAGRATEQIDGVRYANQRAHIWAQLRHHLRYLCLPNMPELKEQMCGPQYDFNKAGEIQLESKEMMKRRGCQSPDLVDSIAVTYAGQISLLPQLAEWAQPRGAISEYDPFSPQALRGEPLPEAQPRYYRPGWARLRDETQEGWDRQDFADAMASDALRQQQEDRW